jgi:ribosomal protein S18 acetylase RimI-like enzyme
VRTIRLATGDDLEEVLSLLNQAASWLRSRGLDQWPGGFGVNRIAPLIARGEVYLVLDDDVAVATVTVSPRGDTDFWTPAELTEPAFYIAKLAIARDQAGNQLGELILRWTVDLAARQGLTWTRLDVWRTNYELHSWYRRIGWQQIRTVSLSHRNSGTLFQRPAVPDPQARATLIELPPEE